MELSIKITESSLKWVVIILLGFLLAWALIGLGFNIFERGSELQNFLGSGKTN